MIRIKFEEQKEKHKIMVISILLAIACFLIYYFHAVLRRDVVFPHFFYIPIILASLWWKRKGLVVAIFLSALLILTHIFFMRDVATVNDYLRAIMFIVIAFVVSTLSEMIAKTEMKTKLAYAELEQIFHTAADGLCVIDKDFNLIRISSAFSTLSGVKKDEVVGKKCFEMFPGILCHTPNCPLIRIFGGEERVESEVEKERNDGTRIPCILTTTPFRAPDGELIGIVQNFKDITERKRAEERINHLNRILKAICNVNQLITRIKDRDRLLQAACDNFIETRGYYNVWIALLKESGELVTTAEAGLGKQFLPMVEMLKRGELTDCGRKALRQLNVVITKDPHSICSDCPLSSSYSGRGAMTVRLEYDKKVYGLLSVSIPRELSADEEEKTLFKEIAGDIAFALHSIELEEKRKRVEEALRKAHEELEMRVKERTVELTVANEQLQREITERKQIEEQLKTSLKEKEVLLKEIHHRVKNNLQISSSLLDMSSLRIHDQQAIDLITDARTKIHTMALIHSQLYRSERFDQIEMESHIQELVSYLSEVYAEKKSITPVVEVSSIYLSIIQATPYTLVINELISNALKHAFKEGQKGMLEISMKRSAEDTIFVRVKDNGIGIPDEVNIFKTDSLGLKLVRNLVEKQLQGKIQVKRNKGTEFIIEFKILEEEAKYV